MKAIPELPKICRLSAAESGIYRLRSKLMSKASKEFLSLSVAIMTVSDRRTDAEDTSGHYLKEAVIEGGHHVVAQQIVRENIYSIRI
jgi:hypothetical protein